MLDEEDNDSMIKKVMTLACALAVAGTVVGAQEKRPASPAAKASTQIGDKWIDIWYGAPIKRGRATLWGSGAEYGKNLLANGPIWRAGANVIDAVDHGGAAPDRRQDGRGRHLHDVHRSEVAD